MRLVHLSDIHLGFRQYQRQTPTGINQRETDVAASLRRVIDTVIELHPDIVLIAGDVFHTVRPTNPAILHAFFEFSRLMRMLPDATVVMVAGNHDTPRTAETGCILRLFKPLGITVVDGEAKRIPIDRLDLMILAVPDMQGKRPLLEPDPSAKYNILLLHGEIEGVLPKYGRELDRSPMEITREELGADKWDYVALGHYHVYRSVAPNAFYSGSLDYTSTNPWGELAEEREAGIAGKGIIEHDLANKTHTFHPIPPSRPWVDLAPLSGSGLSPAALDEAIREALEKCEGGIDEKDRAAGRARRAAAHPARPGSQGFARVQAEGAAFPPRHAPSGDRAPGKGSGGAGTPRITRRHRARQAALPRSHREHRSRSSRRARTALPPGS